MDIVAASPVADPRRRRARMLALTATRSSPLHWLDGVAVSANIRRTVPLRRGEEYDDAVTIQEEESE
jgi:hypothetical protein